MLMLGDIQKVKNRRTTNLPPPVTARAPRQYQARELNRYRSGAHCDAIYVIALNLNAPSVEITAVRYSSLMFVVT